MRNQIGLMERIRNAALEEQKKQCTRYCDPVYDFVTLAQEEELEHLASEGWDDLTQICKLEGTIGTARMIGHRLDRENSKQK